MGCQQFLHSFIANYQKYHPEADLDGSAIGNLASRGPCWVSGVAPDVGDVSENFTHPQFNARNVRENGLHTID